jgi:hypothetical protein
MNAMWSVLRSVAIGVITAGTMFAAPVAASASPAAGLPTHNTAPSRHFVRACSQVTRAKHSQDRCDKAAVAAFSRVRDREGVGPLVLPTGFDTMSTAEQLLVISNLERVDRGLIAVTARATQLDAVAADGARNNTDPGVPTPFPAGASAASLWAGAGSSALLDDFYWMYDDGPGSGNIDCRHAGDAGCWGHRRGILNPFSGQLYMGAASVPSSYFGSSIAEEFVGGGSSESTAYTPTGLTWSQLTKRLPVGLGRTAIQVASDAGVARSAPLHVWASGRPMTARLTITGGAGWSVSPAQCVLVAGHVCKVTLTYLPTSTGSSNATLTVTGANRPRVVHLRGRQAAPTVTVSASASTVHTGRTVSLTAAVHTTYTNHNRANAPVELERRKAGQHSWTVIAQRHTGLFGKVVFTPTVPKKSAFRVVALAGAGYPHGTSRTVVVRAS